MVHGNDQHLKVVETVEFFSYKGNGPIWVPKRSVSLKHCRFWTHSMCVRNYILFIYKNLRTKS